MPVNTVEFRELGKRFIFQGGSPYAINLANEIDKLRAENEQLREANRAFGKRQQWWNDRMFELEEEVLIEREACAQLVDDLVAERVPASTYSHAIRARGNA